MKLRTNITINGQVHQKGDEIPWYAVYPFFLFHMLMFGGSGFFLAYADTDPDVAFLYMHGGLAIFVYTIFYLVIFGRDEVKWMFINAGLGLLGIYTQIGWILSVFDREISDYPIHVHVVPFLYFVLYSFLLHQVVLDLTHSREDQFKRQRVERSYTIILTLIYLITYLLTK